MGGVRGGAGGLCPALYVEAVISGVSAAANCHFTPKDFWIINSSERITSERCRSET